VHRPPKDAIDWRFNAFFLTCAGIGTDKTTEGMKMKATTTALLNTLALGIASIALPAHATGLATCDSGPKSGWQPQETLEKKLTDEKWQVRRIKVDGGCYEVYANRRQGPARRGLFPPRDARAGTDGPSARLADGRVAPGLQGLGPDRPRGHWALALGNFRRVAHAAGGPGPGTKWIGYGSLALVAWRWSTAGSDPRTPAFAGFVRSPAATLDYARWCARQTSTPLRRPQPARRDWMVVALLANAALAGSAAG
jgi:hypothetical protein